MRSAHLAAAAALLVAAAGCSSATKPTAPPAPGGTAAPAADPRAALLGEAEAAFAERGDRARLERAIALWRQALESGDDAGLRLRLSRAQHFLAQLLTARADAARAHGAGVDDARRALALMGVENACAAELKAGHAAAVYWLGANLNGRARSTGIAASGEDRREALCLARKAAELEPGYFHAGPLRLLGVLLTQTPALGGGDVAASRRAFERAIELAPGFLGNRVDFAGVWAVRAQDRAAFDAQLEAVLAAPVDAASPIAPENRLAQQRARELKAGADALFRDLETY